MSYDIAIYDMAGACPTCGHQPRESSEFNYTSNIRPMLDLCGITFQELAELEGSDLIKRTMELLRRLKDPAKRQALEDLSPGNKWGSLHGLTDLVTSMAGEMLKTERAGMRLDA